MIRLARRIAACALVVPAMVWPQSPDPDLREAAAGEPVVLPPVPVEPDMLEVETGPTTSNRVLIDPRSIVMTSSGEFRYTVTVKSARGAAGTTFEALSCERGEFRVLAALGPDGRWQEFSKPGWKTFRGRSPSDPRRLLAHEAFCRPTTATADEAVRALRSPEQRANW